MQVTYVNLQDIYVNMRDINVNMLVNYVDMRLTYICQHVSLLIYVNMHDKLHVDINTLHVDIINCMCTYICRIST